MLLQDRQSGKSIARQVFEIGRFEISGLIARTATVENECRDAGFLQIPLQVVVKWKIAPTAIRRVIDKKQRRGLVTRRKA